jgi:transglutaminase-like putative cysteine protease
MNYRLIITAAAAVLLASFSLFSVIHGAAWMVFSAGAIIAVALAGMATRLPPPRAAAAAAAAVLLAVVPLLSAGWPGRIGALVIVAAVAASSVVRRLLPVLATVATYLAALFLYLNIVFAGAHSLIRLIPSAESVRHLGHLVSLGIAERDYAPPVPDIHGIALIATAGVGLVAIFTDLLAVRLRSPAVAGLPLLVLFSVPVATNVKHDSLGLTVSFCLGITGYLALLAADGRQRLRLWGRLVTVWQDLPGDDEPGRGPDTRALAASGRRIGLAAVVVAVLVPALVPGLDNKGLFSRSHGHGPGSADFVSAPQPVDQLTAQLHSESDQTMLTYRTTASDPAQHYLQIYVLNYSGGQWTLMPQKPTTAVGPESLGATPGLSGAVTTKSSRTTITLAARGGYQSRMNFLPVPYAPEFLQTSKGSWLETSSTLMIYGFQPDGGMTYTVTSRSPEPTQAQLDASSGVPASVKKTYLGYSGPDKTQLTQIARDITSGATSWFAEAQAMQAWFNAPGNFTYTLNAAPPKSLLAFLTTDKRGFCQQFAYAMAVLARLLGIPSRVAVGYTAGSSTGHHTWKVTGADAHVWPELYIPGLGWLRFEPTPPGAAAGGTATTPSYNAPGPVTSPTAPATTPTGPAGKTGKKAGGNSGRFRPDPGDSKNSGLAARRGPGGIPLGYLVLIVAVALAIIPALARLAIRRRRWLTASGDAGRAHAAWRELGSDLTDHGAHGALSESPRAVARRLAADLALDEAARQAVGRLAAAEERARYARTPAASETLPADLALVRRALAASVPLRRRWRARLLPASVLIPVWRALRQASDVFGWLDAASLRVRGSLRRLPHPGRAG